MKLNWLKRIKEAIFPENFTCIICDKELNSDTRYNICDECLAKIDFIKNKSCKKCGAKIFADSIVCTDCMNVKRIVDRNYSAVVYKGEIRKLIHDFKYSNKRYLNKPLGRILYDRYQEILMDYEPDIIVAVPLFKRRKSERGYNQTELLLNNFECDNEIFHFDAIERIVDTPHQASLPKDKRKDNVKNAFRVIDKELFKGKKVLIVDDIFTSGATIDECARVIKASGAKSVHSLTLAHSHEEKPIEEVMEK